MTDINKESISVLNDLIETSIDGQKGFKECAEDIKHPELKALFAKRSADCATAAAELKTAVRALGGDPEDSGSMAGALHRGWVDVKSMVTGKDEEAVLNEAERGARGSGVSAGAPVEGGVPLRVKVLEKVRDFSRAAVVA